MDDLKVFFECAEREKQRETQKDMDKQTGRRKRARTCVPNKSILLIMYIKTRTDNKKKIWPADSAGRNINTCL